MDEKIDWRNFDGIKFHNLCSKLLAHLLNGHFQPNGALGKDQGIDALFEGKIENDHGTWRFQFKFHGTEGSAGYSALKRDIKQDIRSNYKEEQHIVFVTNITLNPHRLDELRAAAASALGTRPRLPKVHIWDGARLEGLLSKYPVLWRGFWGNPGAILSAPAEKFQDQLRPHPAGFYNFSEPLYGREGEMGLLREFLDGPEPVCTIVAPGGYGKTRLAFHFLVSVEALGSAWKCYVLDRHMFDPTQFELLLSGTSKLLLLLDDADKEPQLYPLVEVVRRAENRGKVKLLLTLRLSQQHKVRELFSSHEDFGQVIRLEPLGPEDAARIILPSLDAYLKRKFPQKPLPDRDATRQKLEFDILGQARGVPLVLATYCSLLAKYDDRKDLFNAADLKFSKIVWELVEQELGLATAKLGITKDEGEAAIQLIALLSPFEEDSFDSIIDHLKIREGKFKGFIKQLHQGGFVSRYDANQLYYKRPGDKEVQVLQLGEIERIFYAIIPDPYKDIIVAKSLSETNLLTKLIMGDLGTTFFEQLFQNIFLSLDALEEVTNDAIRVMHAFAQKIGSPYTPIKVIPYLLKGIRSLVGLIPGLGEAAFIQSVAFLERFCQAQSHDTRGNDSEMKQIAEVKSLARAIFLDIAATQDLDDELYDYLLRYCQAVGAWDLFLECSKVHRMIRKEPSYQKSHFLLTKAMDHLVLQAVDVPFGLKYLGWSIGAYADDTLGVKSYDKGYDSFLIFGDNRHVAEVRLQVLGFLLDFGRHHPGFQPLILQMCWTFLKALSRLWSDAIFSVYENRSPGARGRAQDLATVEVLTVYRYLIEIAHLQRSSILFRSELQRNLRYLDRSMASGAFATVFAQLGDIAGEAGSIGEKIVLDALMYALSRTEDHYAFVIGILKDIRSTTEAVDVIVTYFAALDQLPIEKRNAIQDPFSIHWHLCKEGSFSVEDLYEEMFQSHRELFWRGRGVLLDWIGFGDRPNRDFFHQKASELVGLPDPRGKLYVLQAYYGLRYECMREVVTVADQSILDIIVSAYLQAAAADPDGEAASLLHPWITVGLVRCVYLDIHWVEAMGDACYAVLPAARRENLLRALYYLQTEFGATIPFLRRWIVDKCWQWRFDAFSIDNAIIGYAFQDLSGEEVFRFLKRHLMHRHATGAGPESLRGTFLPLDPNNNSHVAAKFASTKPTADFEAALAWYLALDIESEPILPTDAWHLLRYFKPTKLSPVETQAMFLAKAPARDDLMAQLRFFAALLVFIDDEQLVLGVLKKTPQPFPRSDEVSLLREGFPDETEARTWIRIACDYWKHDAPVQGPQSSFLIGQISFDLNLWLR